MFAMKLDDWFWQSAFARELARYVGELEPTRRFLRIHGNYCGPGNRGGEPVDELDLACQLHDVCYLKYGRDNPRCDLEMLRMLRHIQYNMSLTRRQRWVARFMRWWLVNRRRRLLR